MPSSDIRQDFHQRIDQHDEQGLKVAYSRFLESLEEEVPDEQRIVGYRPGGEPISLAQLKEDLAEAEKQYARGEYTDLETLKKEMKHWRATH